MEIIKKINKVYQSSVFVCSVEFIKEVLSPTYLAAKIFKRGKCELDKAEIVKFLNLVYFLNAIILTLIIYFSNILKVSAVCSAIFYLSFSRVNEIFFAFIKDAKDKIYYRTKDGKGLKYYQRITLAFRSYIELILDYSIIYWILSYKFELFTYNGRKFFQNIFDSVYYSSTTITTVSFGDIHSRYLAARFFSIYEVINGMLLVVVCFTIYTSLNFMEENKIKDAGSGYIQMAEYARWHCMAVIPAIAVIFAMFLYIFKGF